MAVFAICERFGPIAWAIQPPVEWAPNLGFAAMAVKNGQMAEFARLAVSSAARPPRPPPMAVPPHGGHNWALEGDGTLARVRPSRLWLIVPTRTEFGPLGTVAN